MRDQKLVLKYSRYRFEGIYMVTSVVCKVLAVAA